MLYKNTKVKVHYLDGDTDFFDILANLLQGYALNPYLFIICLDYELRTSLDLMKEIVFILKRVESGRYPVQTNTNADYDMRDIAGEVRTN